MSRAVLWVSTTCVLAIALMLAGCPKEETGPTPSGSPGGSQPPAAAGEEGDEGHEGHKHEGMESEGSASKGEEQTSEAAGGEYAEALAKLSPEDQALAEKQKVCPVSGEPLGSMGTPVKITVKDREVFLCCSGCEDAIKKEPDKYLAKLPE